MSFRTAIIQGDVTRAITIAIMLAASVPAQAIPCNLDRIAYAPKDDLEAIDVALIGMAKRRIDFAAYAFTDLRIVEALDQAAARGVAIRLYRDPSQAHIAMPRPLAAAYDRLAARMNVEIRYKGDGPFMHLKAYAVDGELLRDGAGNFSHSGLTRQDNSLIVLRCKTAVSRFQSAFERMWSR